MKKNNHQKNDHQRGSVTLISILVFLSIFMGSLFLLLQNLKTLRLVRERSENYLCLKSIIAMTLDLDQFINKTNNIIAINYPLQFNPKSGPIHKTIIQVTKLTQEAKFKKSQLEIMKNRNCSLSNKLLAIRFLNLQTISSSILARDLNETVKHGKTEFGLIYSWNSNDIFEQFKNEKIYLRFFRKHNQDLDFETTLRSYSL